jgi:hypothetical protein
MLTPRIIRGKLHGIWKELNLFGLITAAEILIKIVREVKEWHAITDLRALRQTCLTQNTTISIAIITTITISIPLLMVSSVP